MEHHRSIFHKTSVESTTLQTALQQSHLQTTTTLAGSKRSFSETTKPHDVDPDRRHLQFQRASSVGKELSRLTASEIVTLDSASAGYPSEYSQRKVISATPTSTFDRSLSLSFKRYALPEPLVNNLTNLGIKEIYPWQKQCLLGPGLLKGTRNLVYSAPTGGGKSLVADILMLKRVLEDRDAKALLILPYVALVQEKVRWLRNIVHDIKRKPIHVDESEDKPRLWQKRADEDNVRVVGFFGGGKIRATWSDFDIGVCTFEKVRHQLHVS